MMAYSDFKDLVRAERLQAELTFEDYSTDEDICHVARSTVEDTQLEVVHQDLPKPWTAKMIIALYNGDADELFGYGYTLSECLDNLKAEVKRSRSCYDAAVEILA